MNSYNYIINYSCRRCCIVSHYDAAAHRHTHRHEHIWWTHYLRCSPRSLGEDKYILDLMKFSPSTGVDNSECCVIIEQHVDTSLWRCHGHVTDNAQVERRQTSLVLVVCRRTQVQQRLQPTSQKHKILVLFITTFLSSHNIVSQRQDLTWYQCNALLDQGTMHDNLKTQWRKVKSFPSHKAQRAVLISVSLALS